MQLIVDINCFPDVTDPSRQMLQKICEENDMHVEFHELTAPGSSAYRNDIVELLSLGVATLALAVSMLQLLASKEKAISEKAILEEIDAYLRLRGVSSYRFAFSDGIENLLARNGQPCIVMVSLPTGESVPLYVGATKKGLFISRTLYDWRALT